MNKDEICQKELENDGQSVFLYYDDMAGLYLAFGVSAYYTTMVTEPYMSYSEKMQMPVALLRKEHILYLRQSLTKVEHTVKTYYHFRLGQPIGDAGYEKWAANILRKHQNVMMR